MEDYRTFNGKRYRRGASSSTRSQAQDWADRWIKRERSRGYKASYRIVEVKINNRKAWTVYVYSKK